MSLDPWVAKQWNVEVAVGKELNHWLIPVWEDLMKLSKKDSVTTVKLICFKCRKMARCQHHGVTKDWELTVRCKL